MSMRVSFRQGQGPNANSSRTGGHFLPTANVHGNKDNNNNDKDNVKENNSSSSSGGKQKTFIMIMSAIALAVLVSGFKVKMVRFSPAAAADQSSAQMKVETATAYSYNNNKYLNDQEALLKPGPGGNKVIAVAVEELPQGWQTFGYLQIRNHFKCDLDDRVFKFKLPSMKEWQMILDAYNKEVDSSYKFDKIVPPTEGYLFDEIGARHNEGAPPFRAGSKKKGTHRGLFATWDIRKGQVIHDGFGSDVVFPDAMAYRRFIFALPQTEACDVIDWTWTQRLEKDGPMKIMLAINISAMLRTGLTTDSEQANVMPESSTSQVYYATRDITSGEEILTDATFDGDRRNFAATDLGM